MELKTHKERDKKLKSRQTTFIKVCYTDQTNDVNHVDIQLDVHGVGGVDPGSDRRIIHGGGQKTSLKIRLCQGQNGADPCRYSEL